MYVPANASSARGATDAPGLARRGAPLAGALPDVPDDDDAPDEEDAPDDDDVPGDGDVVDGAAGFAGAEPPFSARSCEGDRSDVRRMDFVPIQRPRSQPGPRGAVT